MIPVPEASQPSIGGLLRSWRQRRNLSQLALACDAEISTRHLSFLETGRALPSREMLMRLAEQLGLPLRERNRLLLAAGYAPVFPERSLTDPGLQMPRAVIDRVLTGHDPYPALTIDRRWTLQAANRAVSILVEGAAEWLLTPPVNALRLSLHPEGMAQRIVNYAEWRSHVLQRVRRDAEATGDAVLFELQRELASYPFDGRLKADGRINNEPLPVIPLVLMVRGEKLSFISTSMIFSAAVDVTVSELVLEAFYPADESTAASMRDFAV